MNACTKPERSKGKSIDDLLNEAGVLGLVQIMVHLLTLYTELSMFCHITLSFFTGYSPSWTCADNINNNSDFCDTHRNITIGE